MSDEKVGADLDHGPGSFTHNNQDQLPSQEASSARGEQSPDHAPDVAKTFDSAAPENNEEQARESFKAMRQSHQPLAENSMETTLPQTSSVDRAKFNALQSKEDAAATQGNRTSTERERLYPPAKGKPMNKDDFMKARGSVSLQKTKSHDQTH